MICKHCMHSDHDGAGLVCLLHGKAQPCRDWMRATGADDDL